jgi:hypothetical protein
MRDLIEGKRVGGSAFHVRDCYVWAQIYYLDSPTDYREYLSHQHTNSKFGELVMLDSEKRSSNQAGNVFAAFAVCFVFALLAMAGCLLYLAVDRF